MQAWMLSLQAISRVILGKTALASDLLATTLKGPVENVVVVG